MTFKTIRLMILTLALFSLGGCVSFTITEQDMTDYLQDNVNFEHSIGVENVMYAQVSLEDLKAKIGRSETERVSVFANASAQVEMLSQQNMELDLDIEFSAIPEYNQETGEVFLKSLRLEQFDEKSRNLTPELKTFIKPAVSMIGYALSRHPVYKLDSASTKAALLKSAEPKLVIKENKLLIELLE